MSRRWRQSDVVRKYLVVHAIELAKPRHSLSLLMSSIWPLQKLSNVVQDQIIFEDRHQVHRLVVYKICYNFGLQVLLVHVAVLGVKRLLGDVQEPLLVLLVDVKSAALGILCVAAGLLFNFLFFHF